MIEECAKEWTENHAKWLNSVLNSPNGNFFIAKLRHGARAVPLNLDPKSGVDPLVFNALVNRDREAMTQIIDLMVTMSNFKAPRPPMRDAGWATETLRREPEKELPTPEPRPTKSPRKKK